MLNSKNGKRNDSLEGFLDDRDFAEYGIHGGSWRWLETTREPLKAPAEPILLAGSGWWFCSRHPVYVSRKLNKSLRMQLGE